MPRPFRVGSFRRGRFVTAPIQLVPVENLDAADVKEAAEQGHIVSFGDRHYWTQRVAYAGIDIKRLIKTMLLSATYQRTSIVPAGAPSDPRYYATYLPRRMPAEVMLDAIAQATEVVK